MNNNTVKDDVIEVIETLQSLEEYEQMQAEYEETKKSIQAISESIEMVEGYEELLYLQAEKSIELVEISKWNFGLSVLNMVLLISIVFSIFFSKLEA